MSPLLEDDVQGFGAHNDFARGVLGSRDGYFSSTSLLFDDRYILAWSFGTTFYVASLMLADCLSLSSRVLEIFVAQKT